MAKAKKIVGINCDEAVTKVVLLVLSTRFEEMYMLRKAALNFKDPEGVHDMRVASRRLRSTLRDFAPHLRKTKIAAPMKQLKEIADRLGAVRDYDVAIIALEKLQTKANSVMSSGLQRIIDDQRAKLEPARKDLVQALNYMQLSQLRRDFRRAIQDAVLPPRTATTSGGTLTTGLSYKMSARAILHKRLQELEALSPSLFDPHKVKPLHEMRIAAKRLRYAMELFGACWGDQIGDFSRQVARMQSSLGELHDCDLWVEHFGRRLARLKKKSNSERATTEDESDAMMWLLSHFSRMRTRHFRAALAHWHEWEEKDLCNRLTAILRT